MPLLRNDFFTKAAIATFAACLLAGCSDDGGANAQEGQRSGTRAAAVTTTVVREQPWSDTITALGTVQARESIEVTAKVSETVERVHFESGDIVEQGDPLVTLSGQQQRAALAEAEAAANEAERLFKRQSELARQQLIASSLLDTQRATRDAARARVAQVRAQLRDRVIEAPFDGVLGLRQVSPGSLVTPGTVIATLDDTESVYVDFPVPEAALAFVAPGQRLTATATTYPGREFEGTVSVIDSRIDPATRAVNVRGVFPNPNRALRPGMLMQVTLIRPERRALLVPELSIVQVGNSSYVFRVKPDETVERVDVAVGSRRNGLAEIVKGLAEGDRIVVDGVGKLRPGEKIAATPDTGMTATSPGEPSAPKSANEPREGAAAE